MRSLEEEWQRRRAARVDAVLLQLQAVLAGVALGVLAAAPPPPGPFSVALTASGLVVLAVLSSFGSFVEWNRDKVGEAFALAAGALGILMALVRGVEGSWFLAPIQALVAFGVIMATMQRFLVRDEARHAPSWREM